MAITVIFFDATGTLIQLQRSVGEHYAAVARAQGFELPAAALDRAFLRAWKQTPARPSADHPRADDDKGWWQSLVETMLEEFTALPAGFDQTAFFEAAYDHFAQPGVWHLYPEVRTVLEALAPRFELSVISSFDRRLLPILQNLEIASFFHNIFVSSELGVDKPSPEIYRRALRLSGCEAANAWHVGDDPERDWAAAAAAGLKVFRLDRAQNSLKDLIPFFSVE